MCHGHSEREGHTHTHTPNLCQCVTDAIGDRHGSQVVEKAVLIYPQYIQQLMTPLLSLILRCLLDDEVGVVLFKLRANSSAYLVMCHLVPRPHHIVSTLYHAPCHTHTLPRPLSCPTPCHAHSSSIRVRFQPSTL